jgi:hypothetical protein
MNLMDNIDLEYRTLKVATFAGKTVPTLGRYFVLRVGFVVLASGCKQHAGMHTSEQCNAVRIRQHKIQMDSVPIVHAKNVFLPRALYHCMPLYPSVARDTANKTTWPQCTGETQLLLGVANSVFLGVRDSPDSTFSHTAPRKPLHHFSYRMNHLYNLNHVPLQISGNSTFFQHVNFYISTCC